MAGWPTAERDRFNDEWLAACAEDEVLATWRKPWSVTFAITTGDRVVGSFAFTNGRARRDGGDLPPEFTINAPEQAWSHFLQPVPPRHHHNIFAMLMRVPGVALTGSALRFSQFCHVVRRVLEIGKWLARGELLPVPASDRPRLGVQPARAAIVGGYVDVLAGGLRHSIHYEAAGRGRNILCLHTAGSDSRQFHRLMADERLTTGHRLVAFDLPWHGRSAPPSGATPGSWRLTTDLYVDLVMGFLTAAGLDRPVLLGASMSGEICLELALRHPEAFSAVVACEACDKVEGRAVSWAAHPEIDQSVYVPEWVFGLMAPDSPAECAEEVWWQYSQGGSATFAGDISFYAGEWDARDRVGGIDTARCPLHMLTGEYDYSCTAEMSAATAAKILGARFTRMDGIGHFPFAENPARFAGYLLPILTG